MASSSGSQNQPSGIWKTLSTDTISGTLKFGFNQTPWKYSINDTSNSIVERLYQDAEKWVREISLNNRNTQLAGRYNIHLFRISPTEFTMSPITLSSDIEQNSLIEIVVIPAETNQQSHSLYRCQLNVPTSCTKCSKFISGLYRQAYRCRQCRGTYHKNCVQYLDDDCPIEPSNETASSRKPPNSSPGQLTLMNPFVGDSTSSTTRPSSAETRVPVYSMSSSTSREKAEVIAPDKIIEKGIFPACIRGSHFCRRYLFRLTTNNLSMTSNLSPANVSQAYVSQTGDGETIFPLTDIVNLVLTHLNKDRDDIFEIHLQDKTVLSVGKKSDTHELQMETAQFYSTIRDQRESLLNAGPPSNTLPGASKTKAEQLKPLAQTPSHFISTALGKDAEQKDLHELYAFTGEKIGEGAFGRVIGAYKKTTRHEVAVKIIEKQNCTEQDIKRINEEADNLYKFNHVNILKLEAYYERDDAVYLVTERMETDLCKYINKKTAGYLDEDLSRIIVYQLIVAVRYLHNNNCSHLDIKCENILISLLKPIPGKEKESGNKEYPLVKLADFGYSRMIGENSFRKTRVGTKVYNAPEIYRGNSGYNRMADMWSVGIVLYAALSGTLPYDEKGSQRAEEIVQDKENLFGTRRWNDVSREAKNLIADKLLAIQTVVRVSSNEALFDPWFLDFDLYSNLREVERRTRHLISARKEILPSSSYWLTEQRQDEVWNYYRDSYTNSKMSK